MVTASTAQLFVCQHLTEAISRSHTVEEIYEFALDALREGLAVDRSSILLFDADGVMRFKAQRGLSERYRAAVEGHSPWHRGETGAQPIVVADVTVEPSLAAYLPVIQAEGIAGMAFIPLVSEGCVIGKFMLYQDTPRAFAEDELRLAMIIASQVAFAVERTRTEEQARRNEQRLLFALDAADMGTWDWDLRTNDLHWSENLPRVHGLPAGAFDGTFASYEREIHPEDRARVLQSIQRAVETGAPHDVEYRIVAPDGTIRWVEGKGDVERDSQGRPTRMTGVCMNVTPRKSAEMARLEAVEEARRVSEQLAGRLATLVSASAALLHSPDSRAVVVSTIEKARRLLEADAYAVWVSDPVTRSWQVAESFGLSAEFSARVITTYKGTAPQTNAPFIRPLMVPDVTAEPYLQESLSAYTSEGIASMLACPLPFEPNRAGMLVFYFKTPRQFSTADVETGVALANLTTAAMTTADLYEQLRAGRNAAEAARSRAAFLADATALLAQSLDYEETLGAVARLAVPQFADWCGVDLLDDSGTLRHVAVAHVDPAKVEYARTLHERYPPERDQPGGVYEVIRTGKPIMMESIPQQLLDAVAKDDEHRRVIRELGLTSYMCIPLVSASGTLGAISFVYAESGRHYSADDVALGQELCARAALALENAFAYRRVNEASRIKDEFLATLSHEMRTPLNAILGYAQMLSTGAVAQGRQQHAMSVLVRNAHALSQIIDDVLDVARITSGKLRLNVQPLRLADILENAAATIQPTIEAKGLNFQADVDRSVEVLGDADRLQQIVWNLLSNAVKFTDRGGEVRLTQRVTPGVVEVSVSDTGQGIDAAFLPYVFERFRQADGRSSREHGGLGLGLAIVRELAELHGGTVSASSPGPGRGSCFTLRLPLGSISQSTDSRPQER